MVAVPFVPAVTFPVVALIVATVLLLLVQVPGVGAPIRVLVPYVSHICKLPVMDVGIGLTVTTTEAEQPVPSELVMVAVEGTNTGPPVTTPNVFTVATAISLLVHELPGAPDSVMVAPAHTCREGADGVGGSG